MVILSNGEKGKGEVNFWKENKDFKNGGEENYQVIGNFIHLSVCVINLGPA